MSESIKTYVRKPIPPMKAVKWTKDNLEEVRKVYPGIGEEYMFQRGWSYGMHIYSPRPGIVEAATEWFLKEYWDDAPPVTEPSRDKGAKEGRA